MSLASSAAVQAGPGLGTPRRLRGAAGPVLSCLFFALGLYVLDWPAAMLLLAFWFEELLTFATAALQILLLRLRTLDAGETIGGLALMLLFPAIHLIFVLVFLGIDSRSNEATERLWDVLWDLVAGQWPYANVPTLLALGQLVAGLVVGQVATLVRWRRGLGRAVGPEHHAARTRLQLEVQTRLKAAMTLPHLTLIAAGGLMMTLELGAGIALGVLIGKLLVELLLIPAMRRDLEKAAAASAAGAPPPAVAGDAPAGATPPPAQPGSSIP